MKMPAIIAGISLYFQCSEIDMAKWQVFEKAPVSFFKLERCYVATAIIAANAAETMA
jgi:hypothetical protein